MEFCKDCHAGCCRRYNPYIWGSDIIRICNTLKVDINFFITVKKIEDEKLEKLKGKEPIFIFTDSGQEDHFMIMLKSNESKYFSGTSKCMFLQEWNADALGSEELTGIISRCGIYGVRPINCRAWPAYYDEDKKSTVIKDPYLVLSKEHVKIAESPAYDLCKKAVNHEDYVQFEAQYVEDALLNYHEKQFFIKVAGKWNENPDISDKFSEFILKEYNNRIEHIKDVEIKC